MIATVRHLEDFTPVPHADDSRLHVHVLDVTEPEADIRYTHSLGRLGARQRPRQQREIRIEVFG